MKTKNRNVIKKSLLGVMSAAAIMAGSVMPTYAANGTPMTLKKTFTLEALTSATKKFKSPKATFTFQPTTTVDDKSVGIASLEYISHSYFNGSNATDKQKLSDLQYRPTSDDTPMYLIIGTAQFEENAATPPATTGTAGISAGASMDVTIELPQQFSRPGLYYYEFKEVAGTIPGITYDPDTYTICLDVEYVDNALTVKNYSISKTVGGETVKEVGVSNAYGAGELTFTKNITGNIGDKKGTFTVDVTLNEDNADTSYSYNIYADSNGTPTIPEGGGYTTIPTDNWISWTNGETKKFLVTDKTTYSLYNIPSGVTYTVKEDGQTQNGTNYYVNSYELSYTGKISRNTTSGVDDTSFSSTVDNNSLVMTRAMGTSEINQIEITNNRGDTTLDTGVFTSNLPYFIILFAAAGGLVIFLVSKKHRA